MTNIIISILSSIPIILISLYIFPFLGICLIIMRLCYKIHERYTLPISLISFGILLLIPKFLELINVNFSLLDKILNLSIYPKLINISKLIICIGVILLIIILIFRNIINKIIEMFKFYIINHENINREISEKNDLKIKEKQEEAKTNRYVKCPHCGADNIISGNISKCKYCRRSIK